MFLLEFNDVIPTVGIRFKPQPHVVEFLFDLDLQTCGTCNRDLIIFAVDMDDGDGCNNCGGPGSECLGKGAFIQGVLDLID